MHPDTGIYKLKNAARPDLYVSRMSGKIVGTSFTLGPVDDWHVKLHEGSFVTFEVSHNGGHTGQYIAFEHQENVIHYGTLQTTTSTLILCSKIQPTDEVSCPHPHCNSDLMLPAPPQNGSLIVSNDASYFSIVDNPYLTPIGIPNTKDVWAIMSWDNHKPVRIVYYLY
ncbi:hypothetical protein AZE42_05723 [Rhizopogon vesiculosus]|uniref:Uncharacterized protein n=1 Tax=Rhizopogon vesiculosus TaxID=180088 RepID=A0A1J8QFG6_9AGAM|nr:hypothetical protein AZE42_05723 [Rhizopogon vesiculosus]